MCDWKLCAYGCVCVSVCVCAAVLSSISGAQNCSASPKSASRTNLPQFVGSRFKIQKHLLERKEPQTQHTATPSPSERKESCVCVSCVCVCCVLCVCLSLCVCVRLQLYFCSLPSYEDPMHPVVRVTEEQEAAYLGHGKDPLGCSPTAFEGSLVSATAFPIEVLFEGPK